MVTWLAQTTAIWSWVLRNLVAVTVLVAFLVGGASPANAGFDDGIAAYNRGDFSLALKEWTPLAEKGEARAQVILATMYMDGLGVAKAPKTAMQWLVLAAKQGHVRAQTYLAYLYEDGYAEAPNLSQAHMWLKIAAARGDPLAALNLNRISKKLSPAERNVSEQRALEWLMDHREPSAEPPPVGIPGSPGSDPVWSPRKRRLE